MLRISRGMPCIPGLVSCGTDDTEQISSKKVYFIVFMIFANWTKRILRLVPTAAQLRRAYQCLNMNYDNNSVYPDRISVRADSGTEVQHAKIDRNQIVLDLD